MTPEQALQLLYGITTQSPLPLQVHQNCQTAVQILQDALTPEKDKSDA